MPDFARKSRQIDMPFARAPEPGEVIEVAAGILWARIPLPLRLDHVNIYFIRDGEGWAVVDTGADSSISREAWNRLLDGPLAQSRLTRVIVTHHHPDHVGLAGWLCARFDIPLLTSQTAYLNCLNLAANPGALCAEHYQDFYALHGMNSEQASFAGSVGHRHVQLVTPLPSTFVRLVAGDVITIAGREFLVLTGEGHAPEQIMLYCPSLNVFLAADQVIAGITPNVSVWAFDPEGDPLGLFLRSLDTIATVIPEDAIVLPGHQLPFRGLQVRCRELTDHHHERCDQVEAACRRQPHSVAELVPVLFPRPLDARQMGFAFSETLAHVNYMRRRGRLTPRREGEPGRHSAERGRSVVRFSATPRR